MIGAALASKFWGWIAPRWPTIVSVILAIAVISWLAIGRANLQAFADRTCAAAGAPYSTGPGACETRVQALAAFERDTLAASSATLTAAAAERENKTAADAKAARANDAATRSAADDMENADAKIGPDGRVDSGWLDALNHAGGLRAPPH